MSAAEPGAPLLVEVDPFDLPEWLGESDVVWSGGSGLRTAHLVEGALSGGPGQLGDYYLRVPAGSETAALARVQGAPIVQAASLAPGVPPRE